MTNGVRPFDALIFDLDGTLIDSARDICASVNRALVETGRRVLTLSEARNMVGWGGRVLVEKALALTGEEGTLDEVETVLQGFLATYAAHPAEHTRIFPGAVEALEKLKADGVKMGICTNKPTATTTPVLKAMGLDGFFSVVSSGDTVPHKKPDGRHILHVIEALDSTVETTAMVGDSENDITASINASVKSVAVTFGYAHVPVDELGADVLIDHFRDLPGALRKIASAPVKT